MSKATISAEEFDRLVDEDQEDVTQYLDLKSRREVRRINIDLPGEFLTALDREAGLRGVTRQSLIKVWLYERLIPAVRVRTSSEIGAIAGLPEMQGTAELSSGELATEAVILGVAHRTKPVKKKRPEGSGSTRSK
jgi:hypothetical protein